MTEKLSNPSSHHGVQLLPFPAGLASQCLQLLASNANPGAGHLHDAHVGIEQGIVSGSLKQTLEPMILQSLGSIRSNLQYKVHCPHDPLRHSTGG